MCLSERKFFQLTCTWMHTLRWSMHENDKPCLSIYGKSLGQVLLQQSYESKTKCILCSSVKALLRKWERERKHFYFWLKKSRAQKFSVQPSVFNWRSVLVELIERLKLNGQSVYSSLRDRERVSGVIRRRRIFWNFFFRQNICDAFVHLHMLIPTRWSKTKQKKFRK